ncbi:YceD family protein [Virgibacillus sp. C22-A2]|uniref:YceD family protein n=1 Tax=Virgibacillus tibetensis TaxID=3042313 RepID=A0ABU6KCC7_9BACI|nr:YceD family protein [Virgibacillus sp. C22-A2]
MKFALAQIRKKAYKEPLTFDEMVDVSEVVSLNNDIREIKPVRVHGNCYLQGEQIIFSFSISGEMILPCARTLVDVPYPFEVKADEVFTTSSYYSEEEEENEIHPVDGEVLDLTPYIKENILLEVPFRVFSEDTKAQKAAPAEGQGWAFISEKQKEKTIDPRLKKLESLFEDNKEDE